MTDSYRPWYSDPSMEAERWALEAGRDTDADADEDRPEPDPDRFRDYESERDE